jgi:hypothetical protein
MNGNSISIPVEKASSPFLLPIREAYEWKLL